MALGVILCLGAPAAAGAQGARDLQLPRGISAAEVLQRIQASGISRVEARDRLLGLGYDPGLADPWFDRLEGRTGAPLEVQDDFVQALQEMDLMGSGLPRSRLEVTPEAPSMLDPVPPDTLEEEDDRTPRVFGRAVFSGRTDQFDPVLMGPVDPGYRIGPGDELFLVLTGDVELAYTLDVTREGYIVIPDVGQVPVNGLTLEALRQALFNRLGTAYSGVQRGPDATTFFDISLGRLRTNQVFVIGDASRPGAYLVSSVSTVFHALHMAGGPSEVGSFRNIVVNRAGGGTEEVDLYDYLLRGDASTDVRLENGDRIFIPPARLQVTVTGRVRRPAIYEMKEGEGLRDLLDFAGGLAADAYLQRIQIDRVLPPDQRLPGVERVTLDVDLAEFVDPEGEIVALQPGDEVQVYGALSERRNRVAISGSVFRPGIYEYRPGMTVWDLIGRADGLSEGAFRPAAHVLRPILQTGGTELLRVSLQTDGQGQPQQDLVLADRDSVVVFAADSLGSPEAVEIRGLVKRAGSYRFAEGMTVQDLILAAGGFLEGAQAYEAEVVRLLHSPERGDRISEAQTVSLTGELPAAWASPDPPGGAAAAPPGDESFPLRHGDRVFVRRMAGYVAPRTVRVDGEVLRPGPYAMESRDERLSTVVGRAGGATGEAYVPGARLIRDSVLVAIDLQAALDDPAGPQDVVVEDGDILIVPTLDPTVLVQGAVAFESRITYRQGLDLEDYLRSAGGASWDADLDRVSISYPSGERATVRKTLWFRRYPRVEPGSTIFVPRNPPLGEGAGINWGQVLNQTLATTTTIITLILAIDRLSGG